MKVSSINKVLAYIILFFGLFDTARNYTALPIAFGYIKDISIYILLIINIKKIKITSVLGYSGILWMILVAVYSFVGFFSASVSPLRIIIFVFKSFEFFLLILIFGNFKEIFRFEINDYVNMYIKGCMLLCFVNVFGYYVDNPIVCARTPNANMKIVQYQGRVSVGQPAVAVFPVILSFLWLIIYGKSFKDKIYAGIYIICIFLANSNTGLISIIGCLLIIFICNIFFKYHGKINLKKITVSLVLLAIIVATVIIINNKSNIFTSIWNTYVVRFTDYFSTNDMSMSIRSTRISKALKEFNIIQFISGMGVYGYTSALSEVIENSYFRCLLEYGILGLLSMMVFLLRFVIRSIIRLFDKKYANKNDSLFLLCIMIVFMLHMYTLDFFNLFTLFFSLALFLNYCCIKDIRIENNIL